MDQSESLGSHPQMTRKILAYLLEHPNAKDTAEGVSQWWLGVDSKAYRQEEIYEALSLLVSCGFLTSRETLQSKKLYSFNSERIQDVQQFIQDDT